MKMVMNDNGNENKVILIMLVTTNSNNNIKQVRQHMISLKLLVFLSSSCLYVGKNKAYTPDRSALKRCAHQKQDHMLCRCNRATSQTDLPN